MMNDRELYEEGLLMDLDKMKALLKEFFALLDITEQTDDGKYFKPNKIYSSRALDAEKLNKVLSKLKSIVEDS
jgi:hypothetical protein